MSLTLSLNGDPIDPEVLDEFAYEVKEGFRRRAAARGEPGATAPQPRGGGSAKPQPAADLDPKVRAQA